MNHPYSGTAGYICAREHPDSSADSQLLPSTSSIPSPGSNSNPRRSHDSAWSTEGTYTRIQRPKHECPDSAPIRPRGNSLTQPLIPLRGPISHPYQQHARVGAPIDAVKYIQPQPRSTSLPRNVAPRVMMTPYGRDDDPLSLRKSAFVPYEPRPSDHAAEKKVKSWRTSIQTRIRRAIKGLRRILSF
ncbi:hypothetical protein C8F04DRAFT_1130066 [Mycena alexandri]|uniref:Uncharacterized protein n=1 Tax=Mycena alexandri TaxID=1745969 RepID=A0AAD6SBV9_9AGAR|nr:hypothetical protein C8F04DRAFT_1130066 [Mycena alexandri]